MQSTLFSIFTDKLNQLAIPYAVTGSVASIFYGEPRMTHDIDMVVHLAVNRVEEVINAFPSSDFYIPPREILISEIKRSNRGHCNVIHHNSGFKADVYFTGSDELQLWAVKNARVTDLDGHKIALAPPEYVIIKKLQFYSEGESKKHLEDVKAIIQNNSNTLNYDFISQYVMQYHLESYLEECLPSE